MPKLFYKGKREELPTSIHENYIYFCDDTGEMLRDSNGQRISISAEKLVKEKDGELTILEIDNIVNKNQLEEHNNGTGNHINEHWITSDKNELQDPKTNIGRLLIDGVQLIPKTIGAAVILDNGENAQTEIENKINKVIPDKTNNIAILNNNGEIIDSGKQFSDLGSKVYVSTISLSPELWDDESKTQIVTVQNATASNLIIVSPTFPEKALQYGVYCSKQANKALEFIYMIKPSEQIDFTVVVTTV